jgi:trimethylamine--corrinoid protein Co-methyltransferase
MTAGAAPGAVRRIARAITRREENTVTEDSAGSPRRTRSSARELRRAQRSIRRVGPAYLTRRIPPYELLSEEGLLDVESRSDLLLEEIGFEIRGDAEAIRLWRDAGASVEDEWRVHVPRGLAREIVSRSAPREFVQHARNPARNVIIGGNATVFAPAYGSPFVTDIERGRRYGTIEDFHNFVKLAYLSPWLHHSGGTVCEPVDVPVNKRHFDMVYAHMRYSDKAFMGSVTTASRAADSIESAACCSARPSWMSIASSSATSTSIHPWCWTARRAGCCAPIRRPIRRRYACPSSSAAPWAP